MAAADDTGFTYVGELSDSGVSALALYDFEFRLYDAETSGTQVGAVVVVDDLPVDDGEFQATLDFGINVFLPVENTELWLEVGVRLGADNGAFTTLSPRAELGEEAAGNYNEEEDAIFGDGWRVDLNPDGDILPALDNVAAASPLVQPATVQSAGVQAANSGAIVAERIPINSLPFTISASGSYYVAAALTGVADQDGITIAASNVTLDLTGFPLLGGGGGQGSGIVASGTISNVHIYNGSISGWPEAGIDAAAINGGVFDHLGLSRNGGDGLTAGDGAIVTLTTAGENSANGIRTGADSVVNLVTSWKNGQDGIYVGDGSSVTECTAEDNGGDGIEGASGVTIVHCAVYSSGTMGIRMGEGSTVQGSSAYGNSGPGFSISGGSTMRENMDDDGIEVTGNGSELLHNNADAGINVTGNSNRIDSNRLTSLVVTGSGNLVIRNAATGAYTIGSGNIVGPIQDVADAGEFSTTQPFTNFVY